MQLLLKIVPLKGVLELSSKNRILSSFYELIQENSFDSITIEMIIKKSDVSKTTFYRYFRDKYELMDLYYRDNIEKIFMNVDNSSWLNTSYLIMDFIYKNKKYFQNIFKIEGQNSFSDFLLDYTIQFCKNIYMKNKGTDKLSMEEALSIELYCSGSLYITKKWVLSGMLQSPKEISELFYKCTPTHIRQYLE